MRIRSIRPEFWTSEDVARLDWHDRLVFIGLWSYVDDNGVGRDVEPLITAALFPLDDSFSEVSLRVHGALMHLHTGGQISRYTVDGKPFLHVTKFSTHQKINRPSTTERYPLPTCANAVFSEPFSEPSVSPHVDASLGEGEKGRRGEGERTTAPRERGRRIPDDFTLTDDMRQWATDNGFGHLDLNQITDEFRDYWAAEAGSRAAKLDWVKTWHNRVREVAKRTPSNVRALRSNGDPHAGMVKWALVNPENNYWQECHPEGVYYGKKTQWLPAGERPA